ncbi:MAG: hypothetical protein ACREER_11215 [Alphaproteobacteria bacterium]
MIESLDDGILVAFVDGELDPARRRVVEARLRDDPQVQAKVAAMTRSAGLVRGVYDDVFHMPVPERLGRLFESVRPAKPRRRSWRHGLGAALGTPAGALLAAAAALVLGLFVGRTDVMGPQAVYLPAAVESPGGPALTAAQVAALEHGADGVAVVYTRPDLGIEGTFTPLPFVTGPDGLACRGFRDDARHPSLTVTTIGIACRGPAGWAALAVPAVVRD